jgi:hypothetical protein
MTDWHEKTKAHPVWNSLSELQQFLDSHPLTLQSQDAILDIQRIEEMLRYTRACLDSLEPNLTLIGHLDHIQNSLRLLKDRLQTFFQTNDMRHLQAAMEAAEQLLVNTTALPKSPTHSKERINIAVKSYQDRFEQVLASVSSKTATLEEQLANIDLDIKKHEDSLVRHEKLISDQVARADDVVNKEQQKFSEAEEHRKKYFDETISDMNGDYQITEKAFEQSTQEHLGSLSAASNQVVEAMKRDANELLLGISELKQRAAELVGIVANISFTGQFGEMALSDRKAADFWRFAAIILMILMVASSAITVWTALRPQSIDWHLTLIRAITSFTVGVPAFYAARESSKHRRMEQYNRRMQLELASFDPFLQSLPDAQRHELKVKMTERFFAQPEPSGKEDETIGANDLWEVIKNLLLQNLHKK